VVLRDEPQGAKPKASLDGLPGFATPRIARKTTPLRVRTKTGPLPTKPLACAAAHAAWCWRSNHPVLDSNAHDGSYAEGPKASRKAELPFCRPSRQPEKIYRHNSTIPRTIRTLLQLAYLCSSCCLTWFAAPTSRPPHHLAVLTGPRSSNSPSLRRALSPVCISFPGPDTQSGVCRNVQPLG
jgi:hypothetical protein